MRIFIDIGHPAHVHYFRNFIKIMSAKGHEFFISARDKDVTHQLLNYYNLKYISKGKGAKSIPGKILNIISTDLKLFYYAVKFKPDLFLSFGSPYAAHVSKILNKPHIVFDDTDHAKYEHLMYVPFTDVILTPYFFNKNFGKKHLYFDSYIELCYLNPKYFNPDINIKAKLGLKNHEEFIILRFVSWGASHDIGQKGLSAETKMKIIRLLEEKYTVFISSEKPLPENLKKYNLNIAPSELHSVLAAATLYIGEGSTTASECSILGTPNIYINSLLAGQCKEQEEKYGLCYNLKNEDGVLELIKDLISRENIQAEWQNKRMKMLEDKIDPTALMVWFVENYPQSYLTMVKNSEYQNNFR